MFFSKKRFVNKIINNRIKTKNDKLCNKLQIQNDNNNIRIAHCHN